MQWIVPISSQLQWLLLAGFPPLKNHILAGKQSWSNSITHQSIVNNQSCCCVVFVEASFNQTTSQSTNNRIGWMKWLFHHCTSFYSPFITYLCSIDQSINNQTMNSGWKHSKPPIFLVLVTCWLSQTSWHEWISSIEVSGELDGWLVEWILGDGKFDAIERVKCINSSIIHLQTTLNQSHRCDLYCWRLIQPPHRLV